MKDFYQTRDERFDEKLGRYEPACPDLWRITDAEWEFDFSRECSVLRVVDAEPAWCGYSVQAALERLARHDVCWHNDGIPF